MAAHIKKRRDETSTATNTVWRLWIDGQRSPLYVIKGPAPKYRMPQEWDAYSDEDANFPLTTQKSLSAVLSALEMLFVLFGRY